MTEQAIGFARVRRQPTPYESFMEAQALPVVSGVGVYDLRDVELAPWQRLGARGAFIQLDGTAGLTGMYLVEIPAGTATASLGPRRRAFDHGRRATAT